MTIRDGAADGKAAGAAATFTLAGARLEELAAWAAAAGAPPYAGKQLCDWVYRRVATDWAAMTNLARPVRAALSRGAHVGWQPPRERRESADGTVKYLFPAGAGQSVETAFIPEEDYATLCVSTQIGCRRACAFCLTGRQRFQGNLTAAEILNQYAQLPERTRVRNIVFMGMGEPLDNPEGVFRALEVLTAPWGFALSPTRLTVSTVGILPALDELLRRFRCHIALSAHSPFPDERARLAPAEKKYPLRDVLARLRRHYLAPQQRLTIEYVLLGGVNDHDRHARALGDLLRGMNCRINLLRFNATPGLPFLPSPETAVRAFQDRLKKAGFITTIRTSRGGDIGAACGQLSTAARA